MGTTRTILEMIWRLGQLRGRERWSREQIDAHQAKALGSLRAHAYAHAPFYQEFHAGLMDRPLPELPVLTKAMLHDNYDRIVTDPLIKRAALASHAQSLAGDERFLGQYIVNRSSGTSGQANHILYNRGEWATVLASFARYERQIGSVWGTVRRPKLAVVASSAPWHISARIGATVRSAILPILRIDVGEPLSRIVQQLNKWQPQILATYASMAGILADEQAAGRLRISPRRIVSSAEILSLSLRRRVQAIWGDILFDQYGATEGGTFAVECPSPFLPRTQSDGAEHRAGEHGRGLHLFEDLFLFEVVDEGNQPVPPGQFGDKVLLTVLFNQTLPLIRYELSDRVRLSTTSCSCGSAFALIDGFQGRREEVLRFPGRMGERISVHPMIFYRILDALPIRSWQVIQEGETLTLRLYTAQKENDDPEIDNKKLVGQVRDGLERLNVIAPTILVDRLTVAERSAGIEQGTTGKAARILSRPQPNKEG